MASTLNIQLTDQLRHHVDLRASDNDIYSTPSEYVRDLIRRDMQAMEARQKAYEREVAEMLMAASKSKTTPMEPDFFDKIRRELKQSRAKTKKQKK